MSKEMQFTETKEMKSMTHLIQRERKVMLNRKKRQEIPGMELNVKREEVTEGMNLFLKRKQLIKVQRKVTGMKLTRGRKVMELNLTREKVTKRMELVLPKKIVTKRMK